MPYACMLTLPSFILYQSLRITYTTTQIQAQTQISKHGKQKNGRKRLNASEWFIWFELIELNFRNGDIFHKIQAERQYAQRSRVQQYIHYKL